MSGSGYAKTSPIGAYKPLFIASPATLQPVGLVVNTTSPTAIMPGSNIVTPASMTNIALGMWLYVVNGLGTPEAVQVTAVTATTFTALFQNSHSGAYNLLSLRGSYVGPFIVGQPGSLVTVTLYNGYPGVVPGASIIGQFSPSQYTSSYPFACTADKGLFYTIAIGGGGACGLYTLQYLDAANW